MMGTMVLGISPERKITAVGRDTGYITLDADAIVLAMGCRERSRGALMIPGQRPSGVLTAGTAQRFVNIEGYMPGKEVVILGSGDIGLIMARRMTLEGARVKMVVELLPYSGGLNRNIVQCLHDYDIPLKLSHTVTAIHGDKRLTGVTVAAVDENRRPIADTAEYVACDTLLLSVGLIPENELSRGMGVVIDPITGGPSVDSRMQTSVPGVFACGNALQVHDLVDFVTEEARRAGAEAAQYQPRSEQTVQVSPGSGVRYVVPQRLVKDGRDKTLFFRTTGVFNRCETSAMCGSNVIAKKKRVKCTPGEMETLTVKDADITGDVIVSVGEGA
jgi:NADPH-dependent 2,4-dienoyl-CoA reductase/sulfur reductase-like enzyme